eukprot:3449459-Rhodomonas_salina.1
MCSETTTWSKIWKGEKAEWCNNVVSWRDRAITSTRATLTGLQSSPSPKTSRTRTHFTSPTRNHTATRIHTDGMYSLHDLGTPLCPGLGASKLRSPRHNDEQARDSVEELSDDNRRSMIRAMVQVISFFSSNYVRAHC